MKNINLCILFLLFLSGCGGDSVKDKWSGVEELKVKNDVRSLAENTVDFNSVLLVPAVNKKVDYSIMTSCVQKNKSVYKRELNFSYKDYGQEVSFSEILPEEVLIYPDKFVSCQVEHLAKNEYGSTDKSQTKKLSLNIDEEVFKVLIETQENISVPVPESRLANLNFRTDRDDLIDSAKMICFSKVVRSTKTRTTEEKRALSGADFKLLKSEYGYPIEACVIKAQIEKKAYISKRFYILSEAVTVEYKSKIIFSVTEQPSKGVSYSKDLFDPAGFDILAIEFENPSNNPLKFKFDKTRGVQDISAVLSIVPKEIINAISASYKLKEEKLPAEFYWGDLSKEGYFVVPARSKKVLSLRTRISFTCDLDKKRTEIGFVLGLQKANELLKAKQFFNNDFESIALSEEKNILGGVEGSGDFFRNNVPGAMGNGKEFYFRLFLRNEERLKERVFSVPDVPIILDKVKKVNKTGTANNSFAIVCAGSIKKRPKTQNNNRAYFVPTIEEDGRTCNELVMKNYSTPDLVSNYPETCVSI